MNQNKPEIIKFTREAFYEKVWSSPATHIAKELGCSDVLIGKVCKEYKIPKPYLGYWAKLQHKKKAKKTPLPKCDDPNLQTLVFRKYPERETVAPEPEPAYDPDLQAIRYEATSLPAVTVKKQLGTAHQHVAATRDALRRDSKPYYEHTRGEQNDRRPTVSLRVTKSTRTRALCILDAFFKRIEKIGGKIEQKADRYSYQPTFHLEITIGGEAIGGIRMREKQKRIKVPEAERTSRFSSATKMVDTGLLVLTVGPTYEESVIQDIRDDRIEDRLNDFIIGLVRKAAIIRRDRIKAEEAERQRQEEARRRYEAEQELKRRREDLEKRQQAEQRRVDQLIAEVEGRQFSKQIREYLDEVCLMLMKRDSITSIRVESEAAEFLRWAHRQADRFDPLKKSPPSVLDEHI